MAEDDLDSGQPDGTTPAKGSSGGKGDSGGSFDAGKLQATLEALTRKLDEVDSRSRSLQGDKDRGVNQTKEEVKELKRKLAEIEKLKKAGLDEDGAIEEHRFREDIRAVKNQLERLNPAPAAASGAVDTAKVVEDFGLDPSDPQVIAELTSRRWESAEKMEIAAARLVKARQHQPTPSDADRAAAPSRTIHSGMSETDAAAAYARISDLSRNYTANAAEIERLSKQLKEADY